MKQILLRGDGYSGRGVRIETLSSTQVDQIREEAARAMSGGEDDVPEARQQVWTATQKKYAIAAMVAQVTEQTGFKKASDIVADGIAWKKPSVDELTSTPEKYFTTKDIDALGDLYFRLHVAVKKEIDDILGEALDVTAA